MAVTDLNKEAVFSQTIDQMDPATSFDDNDGILVRQDGVFRRGTVSQLQAGFLTDAELATHVNNTANPHQLTAASVGAYTTQQATTAINTAVANALIDTDLTGSPKAPTPPAASSGTAIATTRFVKDEALATLQKVYPVGSIYMNATSSTNPATFLGFGNWSAFGQGRMLVGINGADADFNAPGKTGGAKTVTLTNEQMRHKHRTATGSDFTASYQGMRANGGDGEGAYGSETRDDLVMRASTHEQVVGGVRLDYTDVNATLDAAAPDAHQNMSPYITVYMFVRLS